VRSQADLGQCAIALSHKIAIYGVPAIAAHHMCETGGDLGQFENADMAIVGLRALRVTPRA
jgi:hypothetical protein